MICAAAAADDDNNNNNNSLTQECKYKYPAKRR